MNIDKMDFGFNCCVIDSYTGEYKEMAERLMKHVTEDRYELGIQWVVDMVEDQKYRDENFNDDRL